MPNAPALMPCPFCGADGDPTPEELPGSEPTEYAVICGNCSAAGPCSQHPERAANYWNTRKATPPVRPQGWPALSLVVTLARQHPDWSADKVERRALAMLACDVTTDDGLYATLRQPVRREVDHLCSDPRCLNRAHLTIIEHEDDMADARYELVTQRVADPREQD